MKYVEVIISGVCTGIGEVSDIPGYTKTILETVLPTEKELHQLPVNDRMCWVAESNIRIRAICKFLNETEQ